MDELDRERGNLRRIRETRERVNGFKELIVTASAGFGTPSSGGAALPPPPEASTIAGNVFHPDGTTAAIQYGALIFPEAVFRGGEWCYFDPRTNHFEPFPDQTMVKILRL